VVSIGMDRNDHSNAERKRDEVSQPPRGLAADRLRRAIEAATTGAGSRDELQEASRALVDELRGLTDAPEQMLIQMKTLLADAGLRAGYPAAEGESATNHAAIYRDIITWSIRSYYADANGAG
jgi:hypothetical protein